MSDWQYSSIGLDNGLAPARRQAIIWNSYGLTMVIILPTHICGLNELMIPRYQHTYLANHGDLN